MMLFNPTSSPAQPRTPIGHDDGALASREETSAGIPQGECAFDPADYHDGNGLK